MLLIKLGKSLSGGEAARCGCDVVELSGGHLSAQSGCISGAIKDCLPTLGPVCGAYLLYPVNIVAWDDVTPGLIRTVVNRWVKRTSGWTFRMALVIVPTISVGGVETNRDATVRVRKCPCAVAQRHFCRCSLCNVLAIDHNDNAD